MDSAIVGRLVAARNVLGEECAYPGSTFGSEDADSAWEELCLAVDEIEAECKSFVTNSGSSFRQELVKVIAPKVFDQVYGIFNDDSDDLSTSGGPILVAGITKRVVNAILEAENATNS